MIMPQALAAISFKFTLPLILKRFGYRQVLIFNTVMLGLMLMVFSGIDTATPPWTIALLAFAFGFFTSTQYTSMNTLAYADVSNEQASGASSIASTVQQMAVSFGVAAASLTAALFIPDHARATPAEMIHGIQLALRALGAWTVVSTIVFVALKASDGASVSAHKEGAPAG
jgi:MFS family permease